MRSVNADQRLIATLDSLLSEYPDGIREYDLIVELDTRYQDLYPKPDLSDTLLLFQHHFFLRHCLYVLQQQYSESGQWQLDIDSIKICKRSAHSCEQNQLSRHDPVRDYYLDLSNLNKESQHSVDELLSGFWQAMAAYQHQPDALATLGLTGHESKDEQRKRYRQLAQQHHPDKGGEEERFRAIQEAWQLLKGN